MKVAKENGLKLKRAFSLLLALFVIMSAFPFQHVLGYQGEVLTELAPITEQMDNELSEAQQLALSEIELGRLARGLVGFEGDYALTDDESPVSVIVLFESSPAEVQVLEAQVEGYSLSQAVAESIVEDEHTLFRRELSALFGLQRRSSAYTINWEYREALNGVSITVPSNMVYELANFDSVRAIYPNMMASHDPVEIGVLEEAIRNPYGMAPGRATMRADDMHALGYRGAGVVIAVVDTGVDYEHPAFDGVFLTFEEMRARNPEITEADTINGTFYGRNFIDELALFPTLQNPEEIRGANDPMETTYEFWRGSGQPRYREDGTGRFFTAHGSHVAGTIVGQDAGGAAAILGVAPDAKMIAYRVLGPRGSGPIDGIIASIEQMVSDSPDIVNMSLGISNPPFGCPTAVSVNNVKLTNPDITFVVSAGNAGPNFGTVGSPGTASTTITVSNIVEGGNIGVMMNHGTNESEVVFGSTPAALWSYDPDLGLVVSTWEGLEHEDGVYRIFALPRTEGTMAVPGPIPGVGVPADFEALVDEHGIEELQGAFVLVRRGHYFVDVAATAYELGLGGVIVVNHTNENLTTGVPGLPLPYIFIGLDNGIALHEQMLAEAYAGESSTITFPAFIESHFRLSVGSSRGPIPQSFEIKPDIGANGTNVFSAVPAWWMGAAGNAGGGGGTYYGTAYAYMGGTSMSAPHIAGGVALMIQYSRENADAVWEAEELKARIMNTAIPFERGVYSVFDKGIGYMDVYAAAHAQTVVFVEYDRVVTEPNANFANQTFQTTRTGSFSFGGANTFPNNGLDRTLAGHIVNHGAAAQTYIITHEFIQGGRNVQDPVGRATLNFNETTITVPAGGIVDFEANLQIESSAPLGFYEGLVTVAEVDGDVVARLPFAGVLYRDETVPTITRLAINGIEGAIDRADRTITFTVPVDEMIDYPGFGYQLRGPITDLEAISNTLIFYVGGQDWPLMLGGIAGVYTGDTVRVEGGIVYTIVIVHPPSICEVIAYGQFANQAGVDGLAGSEWRLCEDGTLEIDEGFISWNLYQGPWAAYVDEITAVVITGPITAGTSLRSLFRDFQVTEIEGLTYFDTSLTRNMENMFRNATELVELDLSSFDTTNVTNMQRMFTNMRALREFTLGAEFSFMANAGLPVLAHGDGYTGRWQNDEFVFTSAQLMNHFDGTTMAGTFVWQLWEESMCVVVANGRFAHQSAAQGGVSGSLWRLCEDGTLEIDEGFINWTIYNGPWHNYRNDITHIVITGPITAGPSLRSLFSNLPYVTEIEGLTYFDTTLTTSMENMFRTSIGITELDLSSFDSLNVTNMHRMFTNMHALDYVDFGENFTPADNSGLPAHLRP